MAGAGNYTGKYLRGMKIPTYNVGIKLGSGGEGDVYEISGQSDLVVKIYNDKKMVPTTYVPDMRTHMENKLRIMVNNPVDQYNKLGNLCLAWPSDVVYDNNQFVGYVMPKVTTKKKIYDVCRESTRLKMFPDYTWQYSVAIALNLSWTVDSVHKKGYCIGDFNPNNILIDDRGNITIIDTDSFDVKDPHTGEVYKCMVGVPEMLAPELQGRGDLRDQRVKFSTATDNFSLAIHIFNLLMNNCHPFNCTNIMNTRSSSSNEPIEQGIAEGHFYYGTTVPAYIKLPVTAPDYYMLPDYIRDLFEKTFRFTAQTAIASASKRATADEWYQALRRMYKENYKTCSKDVHHVYLPSYVSSCPWCAIKPIPVPPPFIPPTPTPAPTPTPNPSPGPTPGPAKRRGTAPLYVACIVIGMAAGIFLAPVFNNLLGADDLQTMQIVSVIAGLIEGPILAHFFEDKYATAYNGWPWLMVSLLMPIAIALTALALVIGAFGIAIAITIGGVALMIWCSSTCCGGG